MKMKWNLSNRISIGYFFIIVVAVLATLFCVNRLKANQRMDDRIQASYKLLFFMLNDFNTMVANSQKLSFNWVYASNANDKKALNEIHTTGYPEKKKEIEQMISSSEGSGGDEKIKRVLESYEEILAAQSRLMNTLAVDSAYSSDESVDKAIAILEKEVTAPTEELRKTIVSQAQEREKLITVSQAEKEASYTTLTVLFLSMILLFVGAAVAAYFYSKRSIVRPIVDLKDTILEIGQGKIVDKSFDVRNDEIGEITQAITSLMQGINAKSDFATEIGKGNYQNEFNLVSEDDALGKALLNMRTNLKDSAEKERKRNWATQGLAEIGTLLREQTDSSLELYDKIVRFVVKYNKLNQGGLFLLNKNEGDSDQLDLVACFAFERKKFLEKKINVKEGLVGQCFLEGQTIFLTDVPTEYVKIKSGLGEAPPSCLLIVPLKVNDAIHGVLEVASFTRLEQYQIEFIEKLAENIAAAISSIQINERTKMLLQSTQQQAEEMRSQEEEMKQNMEELSATQEEMARKEREYIARIGELERGLQVSNDKKAT